MRILYVFLFCILFLLNLPLTTDFGDLGDLGSRTSGCSAQHTKPLAGWHFALHLFASLAQQRLDGSPKARLGHPLIPMASRKS